MNYEPSPNIPEAKKELAVSKVYEILVAFSQGLSQPTKRKDKNDEKETFSNRNSQRDAR